MGFINGDEIMPSRTAAALLAVNLLASPVFAADSQGLFAAKGAGRVSCSELVTALEENEQDVVNFAGWIAGYVSAFNQLRDGVFDITPWQQELLLAEVLADHCRQQPDQAVVLAMGLMLQAMTPTMLKERSAVETIDTGNGDILIYRETVRAAQTRLIALGHLEGAADGDYGPKTGAAFRAFQSAAGLPVNGLPDQRTLLLLFADVFNAR